MIVYLYVLDTRHGVTFGACKTKAERDDIIYDYVADNFDRIHDDDEKDINSMSTDEVITYYFDNAYDDYLYYDEQEL